ncbi:MULTISPECIES: ATP-grasp ribosomal peptide maturase [unclassified Streptomyces]|uniref:ATP-grasp ribosomal peptide maturase n=1 Tax=unclassified Streptomyces TaxID=2593676 RepID=UPI00037AF146|nr:MULTISPECIES: ATP-grasp ribosomal peptide maturase [unclassified Streptomyces]MYQ78180.1 ATP-grasp ribosomal peptide maturase [Streptomyces sp. SID4923]
MSDGRPVLVLSSAHDVTADVVLRLLAERRVPVARFDPGADLHRGAVLSASYQRGGQRGTLRTATREIDTTRIRSVWVRRPSPYEGPSGLSGQDRGFAAAQALWGAGGILASLPCAHYVNHPWRNRTAEFKPAQLVVAERCGFHVPATMITNDPGEARRFVAGQAGGVVYKPLWNTPYRIDGRPHSVWVRRVGADEVTDAVSVCPHLFQAEVAKAFDVRVTAVGSRLFGARIDSPEIDWRHRQDLMTCASIAVPAAVARSIAAYLAAFGLVYGAFDFAVTSSDVWHFLECNPNGQWAWQPPDITAAVAHAIADELEKGPDS